MLLAAVAAPLLLPHTYGSILLLDFQRLGPCLRIPKKTISATNNIFAYQHFASFHIDFIERSIFYQTIADFAAFLLYNGEVLHQLFLVTGSLLDCYQIPTIGL